MGKFLSIGEILIRITLKTFDVYGNNNEMEYFLGGSEANIAAALSSLMKEKILKIHWIFGEHQLP